MVEFTYGLPDVEVVKDGNISDVEQSYYNLLHAGASSGDERLIKAVIYSEPTFNFNIRFADYGQTPLHIAALNSARRSIAVLAATRRCNYLIKDYRGFLASDIAYVYAKDARTGAFLCRMEARQIFSRNVFN